MLKILHKEPLFLSVLSLFYIPLFDSKPIKSCIKIVLCFIVKSIAYEFEKVNNGIIS